MHRRTEGSKPLARRSAPALALLAVLTLAAMVAPAAASAQAPTTPSVPPTTQVPPAPTTTAVPAPSTTVPAAPGTTAPTTPSTTAPAAPSTTPAPVERATESSPANRGPRSLAEATYIYTPREVKLAWNNSHFDKIDLAQGARLAAYLNTVTEARIRQYLLAIYLNALANAAVPNQAGWERVAACESGGRWNLSTGNGYYGGLQFSASTWRSVGGAGLPHQNSKAEQMRRANILKDRAGLGQWPVCGRRF